MERCVDSNISKVNANEDIQRQRTEWRKKAWSIPDLKGGKNNWFPLVKELMELVKNGEANDMDAEPNLSFELPEKSTWRSYTPFLNGVGLTRNQNGKLVYQITGLNSTKTRRDFVWRIFYRKKSAYLESLLIICLQHQQQSKN